jgi:hypothetical protein
VLLPSAEKDKLIDLNVQEALVQASRNRIIQVQLAASRALRAWKGEEVVSPPKNGLMVRDCSCSLSKKKGITSLEKDPGPKMSRRNCKNSSPS